MFKTSPYLEDKILRRNSTCNMQVVLVDIVSYSQRKSFAQVKVIHAFMKCLEEALTETARYCMDYANKNDINFRRDVVVLPSGDGAAVAFPFDGLHDVHLHFANQLFRIIDMMNQEINCPAFKGQEWCDCHGGFLLRCGISEGKLILYRDLNQNYNIAGHAVNMAARVMGIANSRQIFLTEDGYRQIADMIPHMDTSFRKYVNVPIKHTLKVEAYQYVDQAVAGLDVSLRTDLDGPMTSEARGEKENRIEPIGAFPAVMQTPIVQIAQERMMPVLPVPFAMGNDRTGRMTVEISRPFLMDRYPMTQAIFAEVMNANPSRFRGANRPVDSVSWIEAVKFCNELSRLAGLAPAYVIVGNAVALDLSKAGYRLPTEAEWEYACLGGGTKDLYGPLDEIAWYGRNSDSTQDVGLKRPNDLGLYDLLGNVQEWCQDWYQRMHPPQGQVDYTGPMQGLERVLRGGSWRDLPESISARYRFRKDPGAPDNMTGFRIVRWS